MDKRVAKITSTTLGFTDRGGFTAELHVRFDKSLATSIGGVYLGGCFYVHGDPQVFPTKAGCEYLQRVLRACAVDSWERLPGRTIYVLYEAPDDTIPRGLAPLPTEDGDEFFFAPWRARALYESKIEKALFDAHTAMVDRASHDGTVITKDGSVQRIDPTMWLPGWEASRR